MNHIPNFTALFMIDRIVTLLFTRITQLRSLIKNFLRPSFTEYQQSDLPVCCHPVPFSSTFCIATCRRRSKTWGYGIGCHAITFRKIKYIILHYCSMNLGLPANEDLVFKYLQKVSCLWYRS